MRKFTIKVPAKINLTLDVLGVQDGYHLIESLVASVNIYDTVTVTARRDGKITLINRGLDVGCDILDNNAYRAAKSVMDIFGTNGVDIVIDKKIPVGGGLGGSSADTAGVLNAMNVLYGINGNMYPLACDLGSDTPYMLHGGFAVMKGRGDEVIKHESDKKLYLVIITSEKGISARKCYQLFDKKAKHFASTTNKAVKNLFRNGEGDAFKYFKNDLQDSAIELNEDIKYNLYNLKKSGAETCMIAGSGPSVFAVFNEIEQRDKSFNALKLLYGNSIIKAETVTFKNGKFM